MVRVVSVQQACSCWLCADCSIMPTLYLCAAHTCLAQCCDYGFRTGSGRLYQEMYGEVPDNVFAMVSESAGSAPPATVSALQHACSRGLCQLPATPGTGCVLTAT